MAKPTNDEFNEEFERRRQEAFHCFPCCECGSPGHSCENCPIYAETLRAERDQMAGTEFAPPA